MFVQFEFFDNFSGDIRRSISPPMDFEESFPKTAEPRRQDWYGVWEVRG